MKHRSANIMSLCAVSYLLAGISLLGCSSNSSPEALPTPQSAAVSDLNSQGTESPTILSKAEQEETFSVAIDANKAVATLTLHKDSSITGTITYLTQGAYTEYEIEGKRGTDGKITLTQLEEDGKTKGASYILSQKGNCFEGEGKNYNDEVTIMTLCQ